MKWQDLPRLSKAYFLTLLAVAGVCAAVPLFDPLDDLLTVELLLFVLMGCVTARVNVKLPLVDAHFSVDTGFVFAILMLYGVLPGMIAEVVTKAIFTVPQVSKRTRYKVAFNVASGIVSAFLAGTVYHAMKAAVPGAILGYAAATASMVAVYFLVNTLSVAIMIAILQKANVLRVWVEHFAFTGLGFLVSGSIATLLVFLDAQTRVIGVVMTVPLIALTYFVHKLYLEMVEPNAEA